MKTDRSVGAERTGHAAKPRPEQQAEEYLECADDVFPFFTHHFLPAFLNIQAEAGKKLGVKK
jgi:hypothetical protein